MLPGDKRFENVEARYRSTVVAATKTLIESGEPERVFDVLKHIRSECHFEMNQIGTRLTWLLAAQTFLVSAVVLATSNALNRNTLGPSWLALLASCISITGIVISARSFYILHAAMWTLDRWHERLRLVIDTSLSPEKDRCLMDCHTVILGRWLENSDPVHEASLKFARVVPWVFSIFWSALFVATVVLAFHLSFSLDSQVRSQGR